MYLKPVYLGQIKTRHDLYDCTQTALLLYLVNKAELTGVSVLQEDGGGTVAREHRHT